MPPRAKLHLAVFEDAFVVATCRMVVVLLEFGGEEPGMLLKTLQCTTQFPTAQTANQNANSTFVLKPYL